MNQTYNGMPREVTVTTFPPGLSYSITYSGETTAPTDAGNYEVVATITDSNYTGSASGTLNIAKASSSTLVSGGGTFTYDGNPHGATVSVTGVGGLNLSPEPVYSGSCAAAPVNVNDTPCAASYTYTGDANHMGSNGTTTINITPKGITVTADSGQSKVFGAVDPVFTYTSSESVTFNGNLSRDAGEDVGAYAITQGDLSAGGNYTIPFVSADFNITPKGITVTADSGQSKVFGAVDPVFTYTSSESVTFTGALSRVAGEDVGVYAISRVTCLRVVTTPSPSFPLTSPLRPKASRSLRTADRTRSLVLSTQSSPTLLPRVSPSLAHSAATTGEDVGAYAITQGALSAGGNYAITLRQQGLHHHAQSPSPSLRTADRARSLVLLIQSSPTLLPRVSPSLAHSAAMQARMSVSMPLRRVTCLLVPTTPSSSFQRTSPLRPRHHGHSGQRTEQGLWCC